MSSNEPQERAVPEQEDPRSPLGVARTLVQDLFDQRVDREQFLEALDRFDQQLHLWAEGMQKVELPPDYEHAPVMMEASMTGLQHIANGVTLLRDLADTEDREAAAEQGLEEIHEGQKLLARLEQITGENMEEMRDNLWLE